MYIYINIHTYIYIYMYMGFGMSPAIPKSTSPILGGFNSHGIPLGEVQLVGGVLQGFARGRDRGLQDVASGAETPEAIHGEIWENDRSMMGNMGFSWENDRYPLVNVYSLLWKNTILNG